MTTRIITVFLFVTLSLVACTPGPLEPGIQGPTNTPDISLTATAEFSTRLSGDPLPQETAEPTATFDLTATPTPWDVPSVTPAQTIAGPQTPTFTPTPAAPFPGFIYETADGIWQVNDNGEPEQLTTTTGGVLSPDRSQAAYTEDGDVWLLDFASGNTQDLTENTGRTHCCIVWSPARVDQILLGSWAEEDFGPSSGHLTAVRPDGNGYTVISENEANALPAFSPDGQRIAYDQGGSAWIYDYDTNTSTQLNPVEYGLENVQRIAGPSWAPDGIRIAWTIAITDPDWRIAVAVFNLETGTVDLLHQYENIGRGGWFPGPVWHPDGSWLAFVAEDVNPENFGVWVVNTLNGEEAFIGMGENPHWSPDGRWLAYSEFGSGNNPNPATLLAEVDSWYQINLQIPDNGRLLNWVNPQSP